MTFLKKLLAFALILPFTILAYFLVLAFVNLVAIVAVVFAPTKVWHAASKFIDRSK